MCEISEKWTDWAPSMKRGDLKCQAQCWSQGSSIGNRATVNFGLGTSGELNVFVEQRSNKTKIISKCGTFRHCIVCA